MTGKSPKPKVPPIDLWFPWPKVETHPSHKQPKDISPTKQLIGKFNSGLNQTVKARPQPNKLKSPTKLMINKFNNPTEVNKIPVLGGATSYRQHTINSQRTHNTAQHSKINIFDPKLHQATNWKTQLPLTR